MSTFKARGIILKETVVNDTDKALTILFKDKGKFTVWAKNSRTFKSKLFYGTTSFSYADFIVYDNSKTMLLNQVDLIENFYNLTNDLDKLAYGTYFLEIVDKTTPAAASSNDILLFLLKSLNTLYKSKVLSPRLIAKIFDLKLLQLNGYMPDISRCTHCLENLDTKKELLFGAQGLICESCKSKEINSIKISPSTIFTMDYILKAPLDRLYSFNITNEVLENLSLIVKKLINTHLYFDLKSKDFIDHLSL